MIKVFRNILAIVAGVVVGSVVNMAIITFGPALIPPPAGVDLSSAEGMARTIHLFEPRHFLTPFLAHALGTLVGAFVAYLVAVSQRAPIAWAIGVLFLRACREKREASQASSFAERSGLATKT